MQAYRNRLDQQALLAWATSACASSASGTIDRHLRLIADKHGPAMAHPRVVMEVLGYAQMRTTPDTYSHVMPALGRDAADRMGKTLWD
jgi:hypothetical protein